MEKNRKIRIGKITSNKMEKTVVVKVETLRRHPLYHKVIRYSSSFKAHDENNSCSLGDTVKIAETRPMSKDKRWTVVEIIQKADIASLPKEDLAQANQEN